MRALPLAITLLLAAASSALACRCAERTLTQHFADADLVFLGAAAPYAVPREEWRPDALSLRFQLLGEPFKGDAAAVRVYRTGSNSASCGVPIEPGATYLIFAKRDVADPGVALFSTCNGARRFDPRDPEGDFPDTDAEDVVARLRTLHAVVAAHPGATPPRGTPREGSVLGLVALPGLHEPTGAAVPLALALRAEPADDAPVLLTLREASDVLTREHAYEELAALVVGEHEGWVQLRTEEGVVAWLAPPSGSRYLPLDTLLPDRLGYLTPAWDGRLWPEPGRGLALRPEPTLGSREPVVDIVETRRVGEALWLRVKLWHHNPCDGPDTNRAEIGWVPAWAPNGELTTWFWSRGC